MKPLRFAVLLLSIAALAACEGPDADASGRDIYLEACARCHAADLSGNVGPALGEDSNAADQSDEFLITTISEGRGRMPSFRRTLSTEQIERVVGYLREEQTGS